MAKKPCVFNSGIRKDRFNFPTWFFDCVFEMSPSEVFIILYIIRHTQKKPQVRITLDEFQKGKKRRDRTRIDKGTGLSKSSLSKGVKDVVNHGYVQVEVDDSDAARIIKRYSLVVEFPVRRFSHE